MRDAVGVVVYRCSSCSCLAPRALVPADWCHSTASSTAMTTSSIGKIRSSMLP